MTTGDPALIEGGTAVESDAAIAVQVRKLDDACSVMGRSPSSIRKVLLVGFTPEANQPLESAERFDDFLGRHEAMGFDEVVIHWPTPDSLFEADMAVFEEIATASR